MSIHSTGHPDSIPSAIARVDGMLEHLRTSSLAGLDALAAGDAERLEALLLEREELMRRVEAPLERLRHALVREPGGAATQRHLLRTLQGVQAADARLAAALEQAQQHTAAELSRPTQPGGGLSGYADAPARSGAQIDFRG